MWKGGQGDRSLMIAFAKRIPFKKVRRRSQIFTVQLSFLHTPSPRGEGRRGVAKNSMSEANTLFRQCGAAPYCIKLVHFPPHPSPRGEGRGGVTLDSISASEYLIMRQCGDDSLY